MSKAPVNNKTPFLQKKTDFEVGHKSISLCEFWRNLVFGHHQSRFTWKTHQSVNKEIFFMRPWK